MRARDSRQLVCSEMREADNGRDIDNQTPSTTHSCSKAGMGYHARTYPEFDQGSVNWRVSQSG